MNEFSLRGRLNDGQFEILSAEEYLAKLRVVTEASSSADQRRIAKEELFHAHLRLVAKTIHRILDSARKKGGYTRLGDGIGIEDHSELFNSMAGHIFEELTSMAARAASGGFKLSTVIADRVAKRLFSKMRASGFQKNMAEFVSPAVLGERTYGDDPIDILETVLVSDAANELKAAVESFPGNQGLVFQALIYGFETGQDLTITDIARTLNIPPTTARSAFQAAKAKLLKRFPALAADQPQ